MRLSIRGCTVSLTSALAIVAGFLFLARAGDAAPAIRRTTSQAQQVIVPVAVPAAPALTVGALPPPKTPPPPPEPAPEVRGAAAADSPKGHEPDTTPTPHLARVSAAARPARAASGVKHRPLRGTRHAKHGKGHRPWQRHTAGKPRKQPRRGWHPRS